MPGVLEMTSYLVGSLLCALGNSIDLAVHWNNVPAMLLPVLDEQLSHSNFTSVEEYLRTNIVSAERRVYTVPQAKTFLAALLHFRGYTQAHSDEADELLLELLQGPAEEIPILETGAWTGKDAADFHVHDNSLAAAIASVMFNETDPLYVGCGSVVDMGCGLGLYARDFENVAKSFGKDPRIVCVDGNPHTKTLSDGRCESVDLTDSTEMMKLGRFDCVMSLEVAEHIKRPLERRYLRNIVYAAAKTLFISWAKPGQGGVGHFNERSQAHVEHLLTNGFNFVRDSEVEDKLRRSALMLHFTDPRSGVMVFNRRAWDSDKRVMIDHQ
ncbi:hypothetical protein FOL47_009519 [Perkinsus chesapeaki]|uniref:Hexaprenyldihydroxybenzoate methyltransferase, mitochondrial n=1 Tax=Perkinsus chesapeaki TaxID=330153 RepID=A0A7J6MRK1_PERCH|nr:hypothetical protein FOL47_009519 [Perkinsus chesapeaki]